MFCGHNLAIKGAEDHLSFLQKLMRFVMEDSALEYCATMPLQQVIHYMEEKLDNE